MLLGKAPMRRTTSTLEGLSLDYHQLESASDDISSAAYAGLAVTPQGYDHRFPATGSPRPRQRSSDDRLETAHFLRSCGFCNRRLAPGKDIYMYRGDAAFCSLECRQQQMNHDEGNCSLASVKNEEGSKASSKGGTVAAA